MPEMTAGEGIVQSLIGRGVDTIFGLPGVQTYYLYNALYDAGDAIRLIHTRHEQGAAYMAMGYALATGEVGVYNVVPGPGVLNTTAALATAYSRNARVLCLAGHIPSAYIGRNLGLLHEVPDQSGAVRPLTKWMARIAAPFEAPAFVEEAFRRMYSGRPRPVCLECPMDVLAMRGEVDIPAAALSLPRPPVDTEAVEEAARLLGASKNPMIFVGSGAVEAAEEVEQLAEMLQAPVIAGLTGRGILSSRHYLSHTHPAGHRLWKTADVVLAVGSRLQTPLTYWGYDEGIKVIRIDIDPREHARIVDPAVGIVAHSRDALQALLPAVERYNVVRSSRKEEMEALKAEMEARSAYLEPQRSFLHVIREELPDDGVFVDEITQIGYVSGFAMPVYRPRTFISPGYQGTLGWGYATALGVKTARPDVPVLSVTGDGGFMFNVQELATAVQQRIGLVTLIFNDNAYGNVRKMQKDYFDHRVIGCELHNPDFIRLAEAFGAQGLRAATPEELRRAIRAGFEEKGPTLIEVPVGEMPSPWSRIRMPQVRGYPRREPEWLPPLRKPPEKPSSVPETS